MRIDTINSRVIYLKINNIRTHLSNFMSFYEDGITPLIIAREYQGKRDGVYYTFYSDGRLNNRAHYKDDTLDGDYLSLSDKGDTLYYAIYKDGKETDVFIKESSTGFILLEEK